jgi:hypothetical protein
MLNSQINWANSSLISQQFKRATFTLSRSSYADLLTAIKDGISNLESLATSNIELEPGRRVRSRVKLFSILREVSASIHRAISASLVCSCQHSLTLRLSKWVADISPSDEKEPIIEGLKFHLALSNTAEDSNSTSLAEDQLWEHVAVETAHRHAQPPVPQLVTEVSLTTPGSQLKSIKKTKGVRFVSFDSPFSTPGWDARQQRETTTLVTTAISTLSIATTANQSSDLNSTINLCEKIRRARKQKVNTPYAVVSDRISQSQRYYAIHPASTSAEEGRESGKMISLRDILENSSAIEPMTYRDRLQLAVFVTSSVLQLYKTPWLPDIPTSRNICFVRRKGSPSYSHVFIMTNGDIPSGKRFSFPMIRNPTLLALGILLIEIIRGQTVDSLRSPEEAVGGGPSLLSDYVTARRLLNEVYQASSNYGSAVRRCIDGEFERQDLDLDDADFQQEVYSRVVALLEEDLDHT